MTRRLALLTSDTFRSLRHRNFRLFFVGPADLADRHLAHDGHPGPAGARPHRLGHRPGPAHRLPVRTDPGARCLGRRRRRPRRQAPPPPGRPDRRHGAVPRPRARRAQRQRHRRDRLRPRLRPGSAHRLRQPGPPVLRGRDGAERRHAERGRPQHRGHDRLASSGSGPRWCSRRHGRLRLGLHRRRHQLPGCALRLVAHAPRGAVLAPPAKRAAGQVRAGLRYIRAQRPACSCPS